MAGEWTASEFCVKLEQLNTLLAQFPPDTEIRWWREDSREWRTDTTGWLFSETRVANCVDYWVDRTPEDRRQMQVTTERLLRQLRQLRSSSTPMIIAGVGVLALAVVLFMRKG